MDPVLHGAEEHAASISRHEQELGVGKRLEQVGSVSARKRVETEHVETMVPREIESAAVERVPAGETDSGLIETLEDGSVSIPVLQEEIVVTKRTVVRERIIVRKTTSSEQQKVEADLLVERVEVEGQERATDP